MTALNGKIVDLVLLEAEMTAAGITYRKLGIDGDDLHTYDAEGAAIDLPAGAAAVIAAHVAPLATTGYTRQAAFSARRRTADATATEVYRATLAPMTGYRALVTLLGVDAGNGNLRMVAASIVAKRLNAGAALVGAPVVIANHQDAGASTWAIAASASGNDLVISVTGQAGRTIDWLLDGTVIAFAPNGL